MQIENMQGTFDAESMRAPLAAMMSLADACREQPDVRARAETEPHALLAEWGLAVPPGVELRVVMDTDDLYHAVFPPDPNAELSDESLAFVAGGKSASSIGSAGSAGTFSSVTTTASSASSVGSVGSAGSAG